MNNLRLLAGLLFVAAGFGTVVCGRTVMTLDEIFESAEMRSARLRPAQAARQEAEREISVAKSRRLPEVSAALSVGFIGDGFTTRRDFSDYQAAPIPHLSTGLGVTVSQPVYTGGAISASVELAELKSTAARFAQDLRRDNLRMELAGLYLDLYKCSNLRRVVEANIASAEKVLADMRARFEQGTALQNDITRYELLVSNLGLQLTKLDNTREILNNNLVTIAGLGEGTEVEPDATILSRSLPLADEARWQQEASDNSPALSLARNGVDISRKAELLVRANRRPTIGVEAGWKMEGPILVEVPPINRNLSYWWVGLGVTYNLSSLYKSDKALARQRAATRRAADEFDSAREDVAMTVRADYVRYLEAYEELKTQQKSVELAARNYDVTSTRYAADMALITDMLDAAGARLDAEQQLVNARINIIYCYYKLLFISGKI